MKSPLATILALTLASGLFAVERGTLIFADDFNREDGSTTKDAIDHGWSTASDTRAAGNKQVTLKDGAMFIALHPVADHAVSVRHDAEFQDGVVELRFLLPETKDTLGVDFADLQCKEVWAGHLFKIDVAAGKVTLNDTKFGTMNLALRALRLENKLTPAQQKSIAALKRTYPAPVETGRWHALRIQIAGDTATVAIDGKTAGTFSSGAFAHPTKRMIRLSVPRQAVVDDVSVFARPAATAK
jgi:hypothetical protein